MGPACIDNIYGDRWGDVFSQLLQLQAAIHITVPCERSMNYQ
jgi:hypothetical protein